MQGKSRGRRRVLLAALVALLAVVSFAVSGANAETSPAVVTGQSGDGPCLPEDGCLSFCSDAYDNDGDGKIDYPADPGCFGPQDNDETDPPPPPPPPPDELNAELQGSSGGLWATGDEYYTDKRCKTYQFVQKYKQVGLYDVISYEGGFRVCYVPGVKILSVNNVWGDATWTCCLWEWMGNDQGYPSLLFSQTKLVVRYRGSAHICIAFKGCGPQKHPWVTINFYPNNTVTRSWGVS
jgi:hypothetical protein